MLRASTRARFGGYPRRRSFRPLTLVAGRGSLYVVVGTMVAGMGDPLALVAGVLHIGAGGACLWATRQRKASEDATLGEPGGPLDAASPCP